MEKESVAVRCTFDFINSIFSTNIIATLSLFDLIV
jgi:hypothetical protein